MGLRTRVSIIARPCGNSIFITPRRGRRGAPSSLIRRFSADPLLKIYPRDLLITSGQSSTTRPRITARLWIRTKGGAPGLNRTPLTFLTLPSDSACERQFPSQRSGTWGRSDPDVVMVCKRLLFLRRVNKQTNVPVLSDLSPAPVGGR